MKDRNFSTTRELRESRLFTRLLKNGMRLIPRKMQRQQSPVFYELLIRNPEMKPYILEALIEIRSCNDPALAMNNLIEKLSELP